VSSRPAVTYALAVHNSAGFLEAHVRRLTERLKTFPSAEIILVENGSSDDSLQRARELASRYATEAIVIRVDSVSKGFGNAERRGIALSHGDLVVVVGVDLPFGFSDLDQWLRMTPPPPLVLGSKSHRRSRIHVSASRRLMSSVFSMARWLSLGIAAGDTQGSILIDGELARRIQPHLACTDYLISTEIVAWAVHLGARPVEIPVEYPRSGASTVSPLRDGWNMLRGLMALRRRLRADDHVAATSSYPEPRS
jgi:dolichyl-phosphate beta-glucosyltransferase